MQGEPLFGMNILMVAVVGAIITLVAVILVGSSTGSF